MGQGCGYFPSCGIEASTHACTCLHMRTPAGWRVQSLDEPARTTDDKGKRIRKRHRGSPSPRCVLENGRCLRVSAQGPREDTCRQAVCTWEPSPENLRCPMGCVLGRPGRRWATRRGLWPVTPPPPPLCTPCPEPSLLPTWRSRF